MNHPGRPLPLVFDRRTALQQGLTAAQVRQRLESGTWRRLRRGQYCESSAWERADERSRSLLSAQAVVRSLSTPAWLSHETAAALLRLPTPRAAVPVVLTHLPPAKPRQLTGAVVRTAALRDEDRWQVADLPVTSTRRTVADCLRHLEPPDALAVLDAALAGSRGLAAEVRDVLSDSGDWPGSRQAGFLLDMGDGRRESPLESWSFWHMHAQGIPRPEPQAVMYDREGSFIGRVDFWWRHFNAVGEADGLVKYQVSPDGDARRAQQALVAEKEREDRLRSTGVTVIRWGARDLQQPERWAAQLRRKLLDARERPFRGAVQVFGQVAQSGGKSPAAARRSLSRA